MFAILAITQIVFHAYNPRHKSTTNPTESDDVLVDIEVLDMSGSAPAGRMGMMIPPSPLVTQAQKKASNGKVSRASESQLRTVYFGS